VTAPAEPESAPTGYPHPGFAASLAYLGTPRLLPRSGGWILERAIPSTPFRDAVGCYPLFACMDWRGLAADLDDLRGALVSLAVVADPFGAHDRTILEACFPDVVLPFKEHFVVDLAVPPSERTSDHHRRNLGRAAAEVTVEWCFDPARHRHEWGTFYRDFVEARRITGFAAVPPDALAKQLEVPGATLFRALRGGATVGMHLWMAHARVGYSHLVAHTAEGRAWGASYALYSHAIEHFARQGLRWLDLGGAPGVSAPADHGLARFKRGWSTGTRMAYFCGRILDQERYQDLAEGRETDFFPAYRSGNVP
jgi:hypothetical protein